MRATEAMKQLWVIWGREGVPCPLQRVRRVIDRETGRDRNCVYDEPIAVEPSRYIRRRLAKGDLKEVAEPEQPRRRRRTRDESAEEV
jgi:hypothetical protein